MVKQATIANKQKTSTETQGSAKERENELHPAEIEMIKFIRGLGYGEVTVKVLHGLPEIGYNVIQTVKFNRGQ